MRHSPSPAISDATVIALSDGEAAGLRAEVAKLRRENRALSIALAEMERVAERDMLTPLFNRRYFLSALHQRIARVDRFGDRVVLIYVDVDGLKRINDSFGHAAGDFALVEIANRLSGAMRAVDVLARIGGDEFGILLEQVGLSEARGKLRRLAKAIGDEPVSFDGQQIKLSATFGMTMITPGASAEELIGRADQDMYRAKRSG
jgi:diguanylate cyclase (GGDEF)-like protein